MSIIRSKSKTVQATGGISGGGTGGFLHVSVLYWATDTL